MASEIRVNKINSRTGVGTITLSPTGVDFTGITTVATLKATTGIVTTLSATGDVDIADKIVHTGDTDTAIRFPAANTIAAETGGSERLRVKSDGDVYIGNTAHSNDAGANSSYRTLTLTDTTNGAQVHLRGQSPKLFMDVTSSGNAEMYYDTGDLRILSGEPGSQGSTERLRISSGGLVGIGTNNPGTSLEVFTDNDTDISDSTGTNNTNSILRLYNKNGSDGTGVNNYTGIRFDVANGARSSAYLNYVRTGDNQGAFLFKARNGASSYPELLRITSDGKFGFGTSSPSSLLHGEVSSGSAILTLKSTATSGEASVSLTGENSSGTARTGIFKYDNSDIFRLGTSSGIALRFETNDTTQVHIASSGFIGLQGATSSGGVSSGKTFYVQNDGHCHIAVDNTVPLFLNRNTSDGQIIAIRQNNTLEGNISVSGSTVSLQGAHLTRWSQLVGISTNIKSDRPTILRGTVLSNLDEMCEWGDEDNEQLNCMKVSDVEGDVNVAGVFQDWDDDDDTYTNDLNCAMTGDFVIRIAQGTTVARGDLLMSAGDGTAKPQGDDIIRSKTIAKVISTTVSTTYSDGSYCVPCVLMAC